MLGKDLYKLIFEDLKSFTKQSDTCVENLMLYMPSTIEQLYWVPKFGKITIEKYGESIINAVKKIKDKYFLYKYETLIKNNMAYYINIMSCSEVYTGDLIGFVNFFNEQKLFINSNFKLTQKLILRYLKENGLIKYSSDIMFDVTEMGIKEGFSIEIKLAREGKENYSRLLVSKKSYTFLMTKIYEIYLEYYNSNVVNLFLDNPSTEFDFYHERKYTLIFDLDATVFDTDILRIDRQKGYIIFTNDLEKINFIEGYNEIFLNEESRLYLKKHNVYFVTSSKEQYAKELLTHIDKKIGKYNYALYTCAGNKKSKIINEIKNKINDIDEIIAFGDDEKDALLYSTTMVPFYMVNNYYGYSNVDEIINGRIKPTINDFRNIFLYDILKVNYGKTKGFYSRYFDDIVIYYRRYYDKSNEFGVCPNIDNRVQLPKLKYSGFADGNGKKSLYVKNHVNDFMNYDYNNLSVSKDVLFAKVPGHNETVSDSNAPCRFILDELSKRYGISKNWYDLLLRKQSTTEAHGVGGIHGSIQTHLDSIYVNEKYKVKGKIIYLFDDVLTTGASMMACVELLYRAGAGHVVCFCLGRSCPTNGYGLDMLEGQRRYK